MNNKKISLMIGAGLAVSVAVGFFAYNEGLNAGKENNIVVDQKDPVVQADPKEETKTPIKKDSVIKENQKDQVLQVDKTPVKKDPVIKEEQKEETKKPVIKDPVDQENPSAQDQEDPGIQDQEDTTNDYINKEMDLFRNTLNAYWNNLVPESDFILNSDIYIDLNNKVVDINYKLAPGKNIRVNTVPLMDDIYATIRHVLSKISYNLDDFKCNVDIHE